MVNNADKATLLYNSKGKGKDIAIEDIGGEQIQSTTTEKILGLHINSDFNWSDHIEDLNIDLKKITCLMRRIRERIPKEKLIIVVEAIFNSKIRYESSVYLVPVYDKEDLKWRTYAKCVTPKETYTLQTLHNAMLRVIHGFTRSQHINMEKLRNRIKMSSVNQIVVYHTILETFNVIWKSSSEQLELKYAHQEQHSQRRTSRNDLKVPERMKKKLQWILTQWSKNIQHASIKYKRNGKPN